MSERINIAAELMSRHCAFTECQDGTTLVYCRTLRSANAALRAADAEIATLRTRAEQAEQARDRLVANMTSGYDSDGRCRACDGVGQHDSHMPCGECEGGSMPALVRLRTRAEQAEAEVARLVPLVSVTGYVAGPTWREVAEAAEAEVARLRGEYERGLREAADLAHRHGAISVHYRILSLLDAAPAAEVSDG